MEREIKRSRDKPVFPGPEFIHKLTAAALDCEQTHNPEQAPGPFPGWTQESLSKRENKTKPTRAALLLHEQPAGPSNPALTNEMWAEP